MAELRTSTPSVTSVVASAEACDRVSELPGACRVSPGEVALVGDVSEVAVRAAVVRLDPDAVVLDVSDGWIVHSLDGPGSREAFARLSELDQEGEDVHHDQRDRDERHAAARFPLVANRKHDRAGWGRYSPAICVFSATLSSANCWTIESRPV